MITLSALSGIVRQHARRGLVTESDTGVVTVAVPAWRLADAYLRIGPHLSYGAALRVKRLTVWQHLTVWTVHVRTS